jgi:hypothetical protein
MGAFCCDDEAVLPVAQSPNSRWGFAGMDVTPLIYPSFDGIAYLFLYPSTQ